METKIKNWFQYYSEYTDRRVDCPWCGQDNKRAKILGFLPPYPPGNDSDQIRAIMECAECKKKWISVYTLGFIENMRDGLTLMYAYGVSGLVEADNEINSFPNLKGMDTKVTQKTPELENKIVDILNSIKLLEKELVETRCKVALQEKRDSVIKGLDVWMKVESIQNDLTGLGYNSSEVSRIVYEMGYRIASIHRYKAGRNHSLLLGNHRTGEDLVIIQGNDASYAAVKELAIEWAKKDPFFRVVRSIYEEENKKEEENEANNRNK